MRCIPLALDFAFPDEALVTLNQRNPALFDVHRVDFRTCAVTLDTENPGDVMAWCADNAFVVRAALAPSEGSTIVRVRDSAESLGAISTRIKTRLIACRNWCHFRPMTRRCISSLRRMQTRAASSVELPPDHTAWYSRVPRYDISNVYVDPAEKEPVAVAILRERLTWHVLSPRFDEAFVALAAMHDADFSIENVSADGATLIVRYTFDSGPNRYYAFDRRTLKATLLFVDRPALLDYTLASMRPIAFTARDNSGFTAI